MNCMKYYFFFAIMLLCHNGWAQYNTGLQLQRASFNNNRSLFNADSALNKTSFSGIKKISVPTAMILYGFISLGSRGLKEVNKKVRGEVLKHNDQFHTNIDNYLQFAPAASVYLLNVSGVKGKNNFKNRTILLGMSTLVMAGTVFGLKKLTKQLRPDGSAYNSFPSGHTATAFSGAEFMAQEFRSYSPWLKYSGYLMGTATGVLRIYNNKHWLADVIAGAGIGILSTKASYWLFEKMKKKRTNSLAVL